MSKLESMTLLKREALKKLGALGMFPIAMTDANG